MLKIHDLTVAYGDNTVLKNLNLELDADEIVTLVGPTGCGKSSMLQAVAGLIPIKTGSIKLEPWQVSAGQDLPPERRNIGMVFQDFALFPHLSVRDNVTFRIKDERLADRWLDILGLNDLQQAKPAELSGGQKQRVALARAIAHEPMLMLLDEPLSNLDAALKDTLRWDIRRALKEAEMPAIWVTHDQSEALSVGDRIGVLSGGELQQFDTPEAAYANPVNPFVAQFLGPANFVVGEAKDDGVETVPFGRLQPKQLLSPGTAVKVLVRPEQLKLSCDDKKTNAKVVEARYAGARWSYSVVTQSGDNLLVQSSTSLSPGTEVFIEMDGSSELTTFS